MWRGKTPARKNLKFSSPGKGWREKSQNFPRRGRVGEEKSQNFPRRGMSRLAKTYKFLAKSTNSSPKYTKMSQFPAMARKKVKNFLAGEGLARKKSKFSSPGKGWRGKIWFSDPRNSRHTPPCPAIPRKRLSREKKRRALVSTQVGQPDHHSEDHVPRHSGSLLHKTERLQESPKIV